VVAKLTGWNHHSQWPGQAEKRALVTASPTDAQLDDDIRLLAQVRGRGRARGRGRGRGRGRDRGMGMVGARARVRVRVGRVRVRVSS
jgi:hypothetical protein